MSPGPIDTPILDKVFPDKEVRPGEGADDRHGSHEALGDVGGNRQGRPLPRVRRDLHDRRRDFRSMAVGRNSEGNAHHAFPALSSWLSKQPSEMQLNPAVDRRRTKPYKQTKCLH